ncbi:MAG: HNH endonuclease [Candidatus Pacebacteria bacterium]|nr:HNH endonuclease [Candidatus Paceibacterota bacterium]
MIHLNKNQEPLVLSRNKKSWKSKYRKALQSRNILPNNYNHPDIKQAVKVETHDKCAYCESKSSHSHWGDIEHILAKSKYPDLVFEWSNLTYSCAICNSNKSNYDDPKLPLLNPYVDDPNVFLNAVGPLVIHKLGNSRGEITEKILKLNRNELVEKRKERILSINQLIDRWGQAKGSLKDLLGTEIKNEIAVDKEFSFVLKSYVAIQCNF